MGNRLDGKGSLSSQKKFAVHKYNRQRTIEIGRSYITESVAKKNRLIEYRFFLSLNDFWETVQLQRAG